MSALFTDVSLADPLAVKYGLTGVFKLTVPPGADFFAMIEGYRRDPAVAYAEPNRIYDIADYPGDPDFSQQWGLHNTGQTGGEVDADIDAPEAWEIEKGRSSVLIAIIDTGVDYTHLDLRDGRVRTDIDRGFVNNDQDAMDDHGRGTFVAGIAAASTGNGSGIAGVCRGCRILPIKVLDSKGSGSAATVAQGVQYAAQSGAHIISMSLGYTSICGCSQTLARAINYAYERGSLLLAASGNDSDKDRLSYPSASPRVLAVGATDHRDRETDFSNRSSDLDVLAPGKDIYSLALNGSYRTASGTSASTPFVSGAAGLLLSTRPLLTNAQVWWTLYHSADDLRGAVNSDARAPSIVETKAQRGVSVRSYRAFIPLVHRSRSTFGRLNAYRALSISSPGEVFAPVDTCSSEPSCVPGCGTEIALAGAESTIEDLRLLRSFRDNLLGGTAIGERWISLYNHHRAEVAWILATDSTLRAQARSSVQQWIPLVEALVNTDSIGQGMLTSGHLDAADTLIEGLAARGSPQLRADLKTARDALAFGRRSVGVHVRDVWGELRETNR